MTDTELLDKLERFIRRNIKDKLVIQKSFLWDGGTGSHLRMNRSLEAIEQGPGFNPDHHFGEGLTLRKMIENLKCKPNRNSSIWRDSDYLGKWDFKVGK